MDLELYGFGVELHGFGDLDQQAFRWDAFLLCFAPLKVTPTRWDYWRLQHPTHPIEFRAPLTGQLKDSIPHAQFDIEAALGEYWAEHPYWTGVFKAFASWPAILQLSTTGLGDAIFVPRPELLNQLPSWAQKSSWSDFDRLIAEAFALDRVIHASAEVREACADENDQDEKAREAFAGYIAGTNQEPATYIWGGQAVTSHSEGAFIARYGDWVDWRLDDSEIVERFARRLKKPRLALGPSNDTLEILFGKLARTLTYEQIGKDRYVTLRALNEMLAPHFQIRRVGQETSDTHCFLLAPAWLWTHLEDQYGRKLQCLIRAIGPRDGFK
jgi:hypothetical protein